MKKIKISELPLYQSLKGLFTIGTDEQNRSVRVSLEFIETSTQNAVAEAEKATKATIEATDKAVGATTQAEVAARNANNAAQNAGEAASAANSAATLAKSATESAVNATKEAESATAKAKEATTGATQAKEAAEKVTEEAGKARDAANEAAEYAVNSADEAKADVENTLGNLVPTGMSVEAPERLTLGNLVKNRIVAVLKPSTAIQNIVYQSDNEAVKVSPDGFVTILRAGSSEVHVIPTCNTALFKTVRINVVRPNTRLVNNRKQFRFMGNGALRLN